MNGQMQFTALLENQRAVAEIERASKRTAQVTEASGLQLQTLTNVISEQTSNMIGSMKVNTDLLELIGEQSMEMAVNTNKLVKFGKDSVELLKSIYESVGQPESPKVTGASAAKTEQFYKNITTTFVQNQTNQRENNTFSTRSDKNVSNLTTNFFNVLKNSPFVTGLGVVPTQATTALTPREQKLDATAAAESRDENIQMQNEQLDLLKKIEENTRAPMQDVGGQEDKVKPKGFIDGLFDSMITGITIAWASMMKPGVILKTLAKTLGKLTFIGAIIGGLVNGVIDAFDAWTQTDSLKEAVIAGLGGILEFLSFGLFDAETIRPIVDGVLDLYDEYISKPISNFVDSVTGIFTTISDFFSGAVDDFMGMIRSIGIPEMKFTIPLINKEVSIGPYYPFAEAEGGSKPSASAEGSTGSPVVAAPVAQPVAPVAANAVYNQSAQNSETAITNNSASPTTVVAPTTVNNTKNERIVFKNNTRNTDSSYSSLIQSRFVPT